MNIRSTVRTASGIALGIVIGIFLMSHTSTPLLKNVSTILSTSTTSAHVNASEWYRVVKVVDGDTLTISMSGKNVTLRLIGLDTPETVDPRKPVQCFGKEASEKAKQILSGTDVRIATDSSQGEYDKYGRLLAYVYAPANSNPDGILVNKYMIAEGYGHEYTYNLPYKYQTDFKAAEKSAREGKKGLWADRVCEGLTSSEPPANTGTDFVPTKQYDCTKNTYNCTHFKTHAEAQYVFELCGGKDDVHKLDSDKDGRVCESLP